MDEVGHCVCKGWVMVIWNDFGGRRLIVEKFVIG
jgi:hypothetical protein